MKVQFLPKVTIERASQDLLYRYHEKFNSEGRLPVPVEEILESYLGLDLEFGDLYKRLGITDVLGATWIKDRRVVVDESLDPTEDSSKEGRYRFTIAHELGHWELHRHLFEEIPGQGVLFQEDSPPSIVCRSKSKKDPMEWQADTFAGYLLMPKEMVFEMWESIYGTREPYIAVEEMAELSALWELSDDRQPTVSIARDLARTFQVSGQAMQIRLIDMGLVKTEKPSPNLFTGSE